MIPSPEEKTEVQRKLREIRYSNADIQLHVEAKGNSICLEPGVLKQTLEEGGDIVYRSDGIYPVSVNTFKDFCKSLGKKIDDIEGAVLKKEELKWAASSIDTLLIREELMIGPADPANWFRKRYDTVVQAYEAFRQQLTSFPIEIFSSYNFFAPKDELVRAKQILLETASTYQGRTLSIAGMRQITAGFVKDNVLLFEPLDTYHTEDSQSAQFRAQLQKYATLLIF